MASQQANYQRRARKFERRLPRFAAAAMRWSREASPWLRWPLGMLLIAAGVLGFLPLLGFWMIPLGLVLFAQDIPFLRPPLARLFAYVDRKWPA